MKMAEALRIIDEGINPMYMVSFEWKRDGMLCGDHFPDKHGGEKLIETEKEAWDLARKFAAATAGKCVNIYVIRGDNFVPVEGYQTHKIDNR